MKRKSPGCAESPRRGRWILWSEDVFGCQFCVITSALLISELRTVQHSSKTHAYALLCPFTQETQPAPRDGVTRRCRGPPKATRMAGVASCHRGKQQTRPGPRAGGQHPSAASAWRGKEDVRWNLLSWQ